MPVPAQRSWLTTHDSRQVVRRLAAEGQGVLSRRELVRAGVPRWFVRNQLAVGRWQSGGRQSLVVHNGPLDAATRRRIAVVEAGPRAALAGISALAEAGLQRVDDTTVHVIVPPGARVRRGGRRRRVVLRLVGIRVHESRRFREADVRPGPRRVEPHMAAVQAVLWARTDRQAQLYLLTAVQQRLVTVDGLAEAAGVVRRDRRRRLLRQIIADAAGGSESLGELDVSGDFARRGFPAPERQQVRQRPDGRRYLDIVLAAYGLVIEVDGAGHGLPVQQLDDVLRDIRVSSDGDTVIRIPLVAYRLDRERVLDALAELLRSRGWCAAA